MRINESMGSNQCESMQSMGSESMGSDSINSKARTFQGSPSPAPIGQFEASPIASLAL
jgi:hypothetical protein